MAETKTKPTEVTPESFIEAVDHPGKREDGKVLDALFRKITGEAPKMWGPTIVGYGQYHYRYDSGHEGEYCVVGFSPRKNALVLYLLNGYDEAGSQLEKLGTYTIGKSCLYIKRLSDVDLDVLREMIETSYAQTKQLWPR